MRPAAGKASLDRRRRQQSLYEPLDWVLVRAPLLPVETYLTLDRGTINNPTQFLGDPLIRAALAVGGGNLFDTLGRVNDSSGDDLGMGGKLLRYLIRMSTRPTPYGLFAGVALARWGAETDLALASARPRTRTRPDMAWLLRLVFEAESRSEVRAQLRYIANPRAFMQAGRIFLPEAAPTADTGNSGPAVSIRATNVVRRALSLARAPTSHGDLIETLADTPGATIRKVEQLIYELWRQTLLLTDLRPPLTEPNPASYVARRLRSVAAAADIFERLDAALCAMAKWDALPMEKAADAYRKLATQPVTNEPAAPKALPQVDMALTLAGGQIGRSVAEEAARAAELLLRLTPLPAGLPYLDAYRRSFESRYGPEREVPLLELLDPNFGLGPPSHFHGGISSGDPRKAALRQQTLYDLAISALRERQLIVELDEETLSRLENWAPSLASAPQSLDLALFVLAASVTDLNNGRFQVVVGPNLGASAAGRNLGRFADLLGGGAATALEAVGRAEGARHPDALSAELVYLPRRFRSANVIVRPHPRAFEIVLGTTPGCAPDRVVPIDELVVGIRDGRFYVRWPAREVDVIASAGHMLNNMQAPDVCRFLDDLQRDGQAQFSSFDWGAAAGLPVLPRVQVGRVVLCAAQWRIDARTRGELAPDRQITFAERLAEWRTRWQAPRYVYMSFGDNRLLLDLDNEAQVGELRTEMRQLTDGAHLLLQEALPGPEHAWVTGPGGGFIAELVVPLTLRANDALREVRTPSRRSPAASSDRLRPPGSDWLFAKLYCPRAFEDDLLTGPVGEFGQEVLATGAVDDWFFIRYADPDPHLRLRFRGNPGRLTREILPHFCAWANGLLSEDLCTRWCFDTYDRELERYGGTAGTAAAEAIFGADSRAVIEMLRLMREGLLEIDLTSLAVLSIDDLLAGLGSNEVSRLRWYRERVTSRAMAGDEYRLRKNLLRPLLSDPEFIRTQRGGDALAQVLAARRGTLAEIGSRLDALAETEKLFQPKNALLRSYVHLHCNRLLSGNQAGEEQVLALLGRTRYGLRQTSASA
jgi:thiopeptide-type bacteriocin biosynthesis protein